MDGAESKSVKLLEAEFQAPASPIDLRQTSVEKIRWSANKKHITDNAFNPKTSKIRPFQNYI
jgi:hypothetical protein